MTVNIAIADYHNPQQAEDIVFLLNQYALDPAGGGKGLSEHSKNNLVAELAKLPFAFSLLGYVATQPVALANCFTIFSTFKCQPVVNIHDFIVLPKYRQQGMSQLLLGKVEEVARAKGAAKITLEVLAYNTAARNAYAKFGFVGYELDPNYGHAIFLEKNL